MKDLVFCVEVFKERKKYSSISYIDWYIFSGLLENLNYDIMFNINF